MLYRTLLIITFTLAAAAFASAQSKTRAVPTGPWSGENAHVVIDRGSVLLNFGCSSGRIAGRLRVDKYGKFSAKGTYRQGIGGAAPPEGMQPVEEEVVFSGTIKGKKMTVTIDFPNSERPSPSFELKKGA